MHPPTWLPQRRRQRRWTPLRRTAATTTRWAPRIRNTRRLDRRWTAATTMVRGTPLAAPWPVPAPWLRSSPHRSRLPPPCTRTSRRPPHPRVGIRSTRRRHRDGLPSPEPRRAKPRDRRARCPSPGCATGPPTGSMNSPVSRELPPVLPASPARRRFVQGLALAGVAGSGLLRAPAQAMTPATLSGREFDLAIGPAMLDITGRARPAVAVNGSVPAPLLRWREGDTVSVRVSNHLPDAPSSIHWHGLLLPANMDGVPGMSFDGIAPGESWLYRFTLRQSGTYWYHSHSLFQEQAGLYGPIIIDPLQPPPYRHDREHVLLLSDWTDLAPDALFRRLKKAPTYDNLYRRTAGDFLRDARRDGLRETLADRGMWGRMRMTPTDLSDVNGNTYTYLLNGQPPAANWTGLFRPGEKVLLRLVNAGAMTYFDVRIPGLKMTVVAADGQY